MPENDLRDFVLRDTDGSESSVFSGQSPREAALKAARRLNPGENEDDADHTELRFRERGTDDVYVYDCWAWEEPAGEDDPDWVGDSVTESNVSKQGVEQVDND